jgi:hypothetical protein
VRVSEDLTVAERAREEMRAADLRQALDRALRQLDRAKGSRDDLVDAVYRAARDAADTMSVPPVKPPPKPTGKGKPETAVLLVADWQLGKTTPEYDSEVAAARVRRYAEKAAKLIARQTVPIEEAVLLVAGDLVEGELIFPGQQHRIDASLYRQTFEVAQLLTEIVRALLAVVPRVRVASVIGNHGAMGGPVRREMHPETNADAMAYQVARLLLKDEKRVDWPEPVTKGERHWHAFVEVRGRRWFLWHGDQIKGASFGYPWYGLGKRVLGWQTSLGSFDYSAAGHWHQPVRVTLNTVTHWGAGSTESANTFAQEWLASGGQEPSQWLLFQGDDGITSEWLVRVG